MEEKIALLNLSEAESAKLPKFMASLAFVTADEIRAAQEYLSSKGVTITLAHEATVLTNPLEEIKRKFSILEEVHVSDIYKQNPSMLNKNAIEIYKKVNYCIQNNIPYKKEDETYEPFLFSESEWQKRFNRESELVTSTEVSPSLESNDLEQTLVTLEPIVEPTDPVVMPFEPVATETQDLVTDESSLEQEIVPFSPQASDVYPDSIDIKDFMAQDVVEEAPTMTFANLEDSVNKMHSEIEDFEPSTDSLSEAKKEMLKFKKTQLNNYESSFASSLEDEFVGFGDIEPETYGMGIAA